MAFTAGCAVEDGGGPAYPGDARSRAETGDAGVGAGGRDALGGAEAGSGSDGAGVPPGGEGNCRDGVLNGDEEDVDCGGSCRACETGPPETCGDSVHDGDETDLDCGGSCDGCAVGARCLIPNDCALGMCVRGLCVASFEPCANGLHDGDETDLDCGGSVCQPCRDGDACARDEDCFASLCEEGVCTAISCRDGVRNGGESDIDCGGPCQACGADRACGAPADCASRRCEGGLCATCDDGRQSGAEGGIDCGGSCADGCPGDPCETQWDCAFEFCIERPDGGGVCSRECDHDWQCADLGEDMVCPGGFCNRDNRGAQCWSPWQCSHYSCVATGSSGYCSQTCEWASDCPAGQACGLTDQADSSTPVWSCVDIGDPCPLGGGCPGQDCEFALCSSVCFDDGHCPAGYTCSASRCVPE